MNAGFLDVLHDAGDIGVLAVGQAIDVDFDGVGEITVDQKRAAVGDGKLGRTVEIGRQADEIAVDLGRVVYDFHAAAAEHIRRPDHDRIADLLGNGARLAGAGGDAALRLPQL